MEKISVYGGSGHAKVVVDAIESFPDRKVAYVFDDNPAIKDLNGHPVRPPTHSHTLNRYPLVIAIGNNRIRKKVSGAHEGRISKPIRHVSSIISPSSTIDKGSVIFANAVINAFAKIGKHCILNTGSVVEHDCELADFVHISPNAAIAGGVKIGEGTHVGIGAVVIPGIRIGEWCTIGAGAVIIEDVTSFATVVGNPRRIIKLDALN